ncbi:glycosyltransferase family 2 protein [Candidatus Uhrbacteria bacterium]|nr:glycosyltransferase family 2 protein [Candidatus Uhrbacteria bacterium]
MSARLSIHIVAWNSMRFLPDLFKSLREQTYQDFTVLVIDNGSTDGVEAFLREQYPQTTVLRNARNLGFAGAHNQGIRYALDHWDPSTYKEDFILVTNPDLIFEPTCLERLMRDAANHPDVAVFGAKLRRAFGENQHDEALQETIKSDLIDSTGLRAHKNRTVSDRGAGELDQGQYDEKRDVFGISGALALYRARALQEVRFEDEFFDADFFAYKEDVDLAWRLQEAGWKARFVPEAVAFHYRGMYGPEKIGWMDRIRNRRSKSKLRSYYSNRNQWLLLVKNERWTNGLMALPRVLVFELGRLLYTVFFETTNLRAFFDAIGLIPRMVQKRAQFFPLRKRSARDMRKWFE